MTDLNRTPDKWYRDMKKYEKWYDAGKGKKYPATWKVHFNEKFHRAVCVLHERGNDGLVCILLS